MITKESIESLSQRVDIVDVISQYIEVRKQGSSYVSICPFHNDRNPSMHINPQKGFYHCFACKAGGDVFKFVMDYEKLGFNDAVERVAKFCNFTLTYTQEKKDKGANLKHILPLLNAFYKQNLSKHRESLEYLYQRGLNDEDITRFELGFAPSSNQTLRLLQNENIPLDEALKAGAIKEDKDKNEFYASFIHRITFPIYDHRGLLVGFGGRTLDSNHMAKYVNSPQSALFDKGRIFYAFHLAKESIAKKKEMIICEGYMDAIAFHKAGLSNAVAVLGTALGENHLPLIKRYEAKVILCFDSDEAGLKAAMRSAFLLSIHKIDGKVVILEGSKDPAELVASHQEKVLIHKLQKSVELGEFYIRMLLKDPLNSALDKQKALENVQKYTHLLEPLVASSYVGLVSRLLGVDENLIKLTGKSSLKASFVPNSRISRERVYIAEFGLLDFLKDSAEARELFVQISDAVCFEHKELLSKILKGLGREDSDIREFELYNIRGVKDMGEFLLGIVKVNLAFLNRIKIENPSLALKKQLFTLFDRNHHKLAKVLKNTEMNEFLKQILILLRQKNTEETLEMIFKHFYRVFQKSSLNRADLVWDKNTLEEDEENPF